MASLNRPTSSSGAWYVKEIGGRLEEDLKLFINIDHPIVQSLSSKNLERPATPGSIMSTVVEKSAAEGARGDEVEGVSSNGNGSSLRTAETLLRLLPIAPCVAALLVMLHDSQDNEFGSVSYSHVGAFRFLVHANGICAGYSLLSAIISAKSRPPTKSLTWTFFCVDQLLTYIILGAGAVSTEILYLAFKGDSTITWSPACESFGGFCHRATTSVIITFLVVACFAFISLISSYKLFSKFDAPAINPIKTIQAATFG